MSRFSRGLIVWYKQNERDLPWRKTSDPYKVWVSEIILQQTRVNQGLNYYINFVNCFPTVFDLANAAEDEVLKQWEGLGYYSRARNMHAAAKEVAYNLKGKFPNNYDQLIKLKGIGPYTAAAISSICFNEHRTVVDGNVFRVLTRIFGIDTPINSSKGKNEVETLAHELNDDGDHGTFNQALMEFGAINCTPKLPKCNGCMFELECVALKTGMVDKLPVKEKKLIIRHRFLNFLFVIDQNNQTIIQRRNENDIWKGLYQFPLIETSKEESEEIVLSNSNYAFVKGATITSVNSSKHKLTHQTLYIRIISLQVKFDNTNLPPDYQLINLNEIGEYALPKPLDNFCKHIL